MKYVWIFVAVVILVRIDLVLRFFEKTAVKYETSQSAKNDGAVIISNSELVATNKDLTLKTTPRKLFFSLIEDFQAAPDSGIKDKAIETLRSQPSMFNEILDPQLESALYRLRDQLYAKNKLASEFLFEVMKSLKGENLEMVKRLLSFTIDADMTEFLTMYSKTNDSNCLIITYLGDNLPEEEKFNELNERLKVLDALLVSDKAEQIKPFGKMCQMVLRLHLDKMSPAVEEPPQVISTPEPTSTPGISP